MLLDLVRITPCGRSSYGVSLYPTRSSNWLGRASLVVVVALAVIALAARAPGGADRAPPLRAPLLPLGLRVILRAAILAAVLADLAHRRESETEPEAVWECGRRELWTSPAAIA